MDLYACVSVYQCLYMCIYMFTLSLKWFPLIFSQLFVLFFQNRMQALMLFPPSSAARNRWARKLGMSWTSRTVRTSRRAPATGVNPQARVSADSLSIMRHRGGLQPADCSDLLPLWCFVDNLHCSYQIPCKEMSLKTFQFSVAALI